MSETVKLIIEIPKEEYKRSKLAYNYDSRRMDNLSRIIGNGTPLDDVKTEIQDLYVGYRRGYEIKADVLKILDNIGNAESEDDEE